MATRTMESLGARVDGSATAPLTLDSSGPDTGHPDHGSADHVRRHRPAPMEIWHPWASRMWPATSSEESTFVEHLHRMSDGESDRFERRDVTALVTALRCGLTADELFERARGLRPARLLAAHQALEAQRSLGERAWHDIVEHPTVSTLERREAFAGSVVPVIISHLTSVARRHPKALERAVSEADAQITRTSSSVALLEEQLDVCIAPSERAVDIGALMFDRRGEGAWSLGTFLPWRVGQLVPLRVAALLGESRPAARAAGC